MATPSLTRHVLPGALGDVHVDVRSGGRATPRPAVVVVHGFKGFKDFALFPPFAERLAQAGFTAVTYNASGSGVDPAGGFTLPDRFARNTYGAELADLATVLDALTTGGLGTAPPAAVGLVGHSRGGGVAVLHAAGDPRVRALVTWAAISHTDRWSAEEKEQWRLAGHVDVVNARTKQVLPLGTAVLDDLERHGPERDVEAAAARVAVPWLVVHGTADDSVAADEARVLHAASGRDTTELLLIEGANHVFGTVHPWAGPTPHYREVADRTVRWMGTHL